MELVLPGIGLIFWMTLSFGIVLLILRKFAWRPIVNTIHQREAHIAQSIENASEIAAQLAELQSLKDNLLQEGFTEKENIILEAKRQKDEILKEAREKALEEARKIMEQAHIAMQNEKEMALKQLRAEVAAISIGMAEKVLRKELEDPAKQRDMIFELLNEASPN